MERIGIIDLGSNSARLVIVKLFDEHFMVEDEMKESVRLGQDMDRDGFLKPQRIAETIKTLKMFKRLCDAKGVTRMIAVATAAVRRAKNQRSFLDEIQATCGIKVSVLSEEEEATLVYRGVINSMDIPKGIILEIGGGSTKIVYYNRRTILNYVTLGFGAVTLTDLFKDDGSTREQTERIEDYKEAKEQLKTLLKQSVKMRMIADVPLGSFLSGGYDSSLVTAIAQECSESPVKTFSIGFHEEKYNEAKYARAVAEHLGTDHTELYIDEQDMFKLVESIPKYYDEPFADSSQIATMMVSQLAREHVTVALSGDGGDEFFCGYNIYDNVGQAQKLDRLGGMVHGLCNLPGIRQMHMEERLPFKVRVIAGNRERESKTQFGAGNYPARARAMVKRLSAGEEALPVQYLTESGYGVQDWQIRRMLLDMDTYLPGDILCKVDRASMKYSLESRCPILDKEVMECSFRIPHKYKYAGGSKKYILKDIAYDYIPKELLERPKVGFGVPLDKWLRGPLREQLSDYSSYEYLKKQGVFDAEYVSGKVGEYIKTGDAGPATGANYSKITWSFFVFQQWYETYMRS